MGLTVVTHTIGTRPDLLARCVESVERQLPPGAKHKIIQTKYFDASRITSLEVDDVIAYVDDDDIVTNDSLSKCYDVISTNDCHLVFTNERQVDLTGNVISASPHTNITYQQIATHPRVAHHLSMFRPDKVTDAWGISKKYGVGICWLIKAEAGIKGGAIHIPEFGYDWTHHTSNMSDETPNAQAMVTNFRSLHAEMRNWLTPQHNRRVSVFDPVTKKVTDFET